VFVANYLAKAMSHVELFDRSGKSLGALKLQQDVG
jgi:hypothetical protein